MSTDSRTSGRLVALIIGELIVGAGLVALAQSMSSTFSLVASGSGVILGTHAVLLVLSTPEQQTTT